MANFSTVMMSWVRAELAEIAEIAGRPLTADDVEPMTWLYYEVERGLRRRRVRDVAQRAAAWSRRIVSWWLDDGFDLLLTPTLAEPPPLLGDIGGQADGGGNSAARSIPFAAYPAPFNMTGQPAMSVPLYWSDDGPADRRAARRGAVPRGPAGPGRGAARAGAAVGRPPAAGARMSPPHMQS